MNIANKLKANYERDKEDSNRMPLNNPDMESNQEYLISTRRAKTGSQSKMKSFFKEALEESFASSIDDKVN